MKKRIALLSILLVILGSVALYTRSTLVDDLSRTDIDQLYLGYVNEDLYGEEEQDVYIEALFRHLDMASLIARVKFTGERNPMYQCVLSKVEILDVIKGNTSLIGEAIGVYELARYSTWDDYSVLEISSANNLMLPDEEYYVFLNPMKYRTSPYMDVDEYTGDINYSARNMEVDLGPTYFPPYIYPTTISSQRVLIIDSSNLNSHTYQYKDIKRYQYIVRTDEGSIQAKKIYSVVMERYIADKL